MSERRVQLIVRAPIAFALLFACSSAAPPAAAPAPKARVVKQLEVSAHHGHACQTQADCAPDAVCGTTQICRQRCDPDHDMCAGDGHAASRQCEATGSGGLCELAGAGE